MNKLLPNCLSGSNRLLYAYRICGSNEPVYQAVWADNIDFDEVLISPSMVQDHMPDKVIEALEKVSGTYSADFCL